jgi:hypothetical protein
MSLLSDDEILNVLNKFDDTSKKWSFEEYVGVLEINNGKLYCFLV